MIIMFGYIYKITNKLNGKIYVGKTTQSIEKRFQDHLYAAQAGNRSHLYEAIRLYGPDNFFIECIDSADTLEELNIKEQLWIKELNSTDNALGYNMSSGGDGGNTLLGRKVMCNPVDDSEIYVLSIDIPYYESLGYVLGTSEKRRQNNLGDKNPRFGKHNSKEHNEAIGKAWRGKTRSKENRYKLHLSKLGKNNPQYNKFGKLHPNYGKIFVTNGVLNKLIFSDELETYISLGFHKGMTKTCKGDDNNEVS